jgi:hypothetical protein
MARTDALAVNGVDDAIARAQLACEAGADLLFVEAPTTTDEMRRICTQIAGPCLANNVETGLSPLLPAAELQAIGYAAVVFPVVATYARRAHPRPALRDDQAHWHDGGVPAAALRVQRVQRPRSVRRRKGSARRAAGIRRSVVARRRNRTPSLTSDRKEKRHAAHFHPPLACRRNDRARRSATAQQAG